jgi:hypothetical protein
MRKKDNCLRSFLFFSIQSGVSNRRLLLFAMLYFGLCLPVRSEPKLRLEVGGGRIEVVVISGSLQLSNVELLAWVRNAAESVSAYYGHFPVSHLGIRIKPFDGRGVRSGRTFPTGGGLIVIRVGSETTRDELAGDWMMTHEMVHLSFPSVADQHNWIEEGIATYVEPIARIQAGHLDPASMWADLVRDMPKGLPEVGDQGLDNTHTWGRTYWGGALFCFLADVQIRRETKNERGLIDALRGILNAGGDMTREWELDDALRIGDQATGTHVLIKLYLDLRDKPVRPDLPSIWHQLGITVENGEIHFQGNAELSAVRVSITSVAPVL